MKLPDTPAGAQLQWLLDMISGGARTLTEDTVAAHFSPEFLAAVPAPRHVAALLELSDQIGDFRLGRLAAKSPFLLFAELVVGDDAVYVMCGVGADPPHLIGGLGFRGAGEPRHDGPVVPWRDIASAGGEPRRTSNLPDALVATLDDQLAGAREEGRLVGMGAAVVADGEVVYEATAGVSNVSTGSAVSADTVFRLGSIAKTLTALTVMQLRDEGVVDLDQPAGRGAPTYRELLTHTSGLADAGKTARRGAHHYCNAGYELLGRAIEEVTGAPFASEVRRRVLDPVAMSASDTVLSDRLDRSRFAAGYDVEFDDVVPPPPVETAAAAPAAGSLFSPLGDFARYAVALARAATPDGTQVLAPATLAEMLVPHVSAGALGAQGLGFFLSELDGRTAAWHHGHWPGFRAALWLVPDARAAAVVVTNTAATGFEWLGPRLISRVLAP